MDNQQHVPSDSLPADEAERQKDSESKKKLILQSIALFLSPFILIITALILYAVANMLFAVTGVSDTSTLRRVLNILMFILGGAGVLMFIVGPILAIIRLIKVLR